MSLLYVRTSVTSLVTSCVNVAPNFPTHSARHGMYMLICSYVSLHLRIPQHTDLYILMSRLLNTLGLFLGLWTFASLVGMFVDGAHITFWATGFGVGMALLLLWAPTYLFVKSRQVMRTDPAYASAASPSPLLTWLIIVPAAALALFLFSVVQVILAGDVTNWVNIGVGAFAVAAITAPILIFIRGLRTQRSVPTPEDADPFVEDRAMPFSLSDLPTAPADDEPDELGWPYSTTDDFSIEDEEQGAAGNEKRVLQ